MYIYHGLLASDVEAKEALHSSYNFTGTLAGIIYCNRSTPEEPLVLQVRIWDSVVITQAGFELVLLTETQTCVGS